MTQFIFPNINPTSSTWELVTNTRVFRSPLTNAVQTASRKGSLWKCTMQYNNVSGVTKATLQAFLSRLNGQEHRMLLRDFAYSRRGAGADSTLVAAASQSGTEVSLTGGPASAQGYMKSGDYLRIGNELHMVVSDWDAGTQTETDSYNTDSSGNVTVNIAPPIRNTTAASAPFTNADVVPPVLGVFILGNNPSWSNDVGGISSITIEAMEDVLA